MSSSASEAIRALIAQWHKRANELDVIPDEVAVQSRYAVRDCANELEALLCAPSGETPHGWQPSREPSK